MQSAPLPANESARLAALRDLAVLDRNRKTCTTM